MISVLSQAAVVMGFKTYLGDESQFVSGVQSKENSASVRLGRFKTQIFRNK